MEDLLDTETGKNDYDWLLTPPGTPRIPALDASEKAPSSIASKCTVTRSSSTTRASRLYTSEPENGRSTFNTRPARSNSVSRPSIQSTLTSSNNRSSVLNASISSASSRPTTPSKRTSTLTASKPSVPSSCPVPPRSATPTKTRPSTPSKTRPSTPVKNRPSVSNSMTNTTAPKILSAPSSRSGTPTSRSRITSSSSSSITSVSRPGSSSGKIPAMTRTTSATSTIPSVSRPSSRSSTPTRQPVMRSSAPSVGHSPSVGRSNILISNGRSLPSSARNSAPSSAPSSRPSSPNTQSRALVHPLDIPDFPSETPPNLRTKLPERPLSTGRVRPGMVSGRSTQNVEPVPAGPVKKMSVPAITRSKTSSLTNGHQNRQSERSVLEGQPARTSWSATGTDNGFGRTISRKSLDMAIKHMDIRQNLGGIRGASLFPHSIRSTTAKGRPSRGSDPGHSISNGDQYNTDNSSTNGHFSGDSSSALSHNGGSSIGSPDRESLGAKGVLSELDIYANSRYEAMLLREDTKNMNWLHSVDDKSNQSPVFDHRFEPLPEPFGPL